MIGLELTPEHPIARVAELGERAEAEGFDAVFASSHYNNRDPFVALDRIARRTDELLVGPGVANPYETHPVALAARVASLDEATGGRALFGLGAGDRSTLSNLGYDRDRPLGRVLETMRVARRLFDGERVDHEGTFLARDAGMNFADRIVSIPVYVGAQGPHMTRMAAKHADGVLYNGAHPLDVAWAAERVEEGLAERPEDRGAVDVAAYASVSVAADDEAARAAARPPVAFIAAGAADPVLQRHDLDTGVARTIGEHIEAGRFDAAFEAVTPAMIDAFCIAGTPATVDDRVTALLEYVDSVVLGAPLGPDPEHAIEVAGAVSRDPALRD
jgi:5,10-methylenetetrahydromethanopterin reductase